MPLYSERMQKLGTENAFKIGPHITMVESRKGPVVKMNLGEPDFSAPKWVKDELIRQIQADNLHYCDPKGILSMKTSFSGGNNIFPLPPCPACRSGPLSAAVFQNPLPGPAGASAMLSCRALRRPMPSRT